MAGVLNGDLLRDRVMPDEQLIELVKNVDARVARVEQILPSLTTREELQAAVALLATREELQAAIAPLATRQELHEEGERLRRYIDVLVEDLRDDNRIILEHLVTLSARVDALAQR